SLPLLPRPELGLGSLPGASRGQIGSSQDTEEGVEMKRLLVLVLSAGLVAGLVAIALSRNSAEAARHGSLLRGAVGADFDSQLPGGSPVGADFGVDVSLPRPAGNGLGDNDVFIALRWKNGGGPTEPTTSDTSARCTGTLARPTAPR